MKGIKSFFNRITENVFGKKPNTSVDEIEQSKPNARIDEVEQPKKQDVSPPVEGVPSKYGKTKPAPKPPSNPPLTTQNPPISEAAAFTPPPAPPLPASLIDAAIRNNTGLQPKAVELNNQNPPSKTHEDAKNIEARQDGDARSNMFQELNAKLSAIREKIDSFNQGHDKGQNMQDIMIPKKPVQGPMHKMLNSKEALAVLANAQRMSEGSTSKGVNDDNGVDPKEWEDEKPISQVKEKPTPPPKPSQEAIKEAFQANGARGEWSQKVVDSKRAVKDMGGRS
ncbi:hypothetical protein Cyrtocomes_01167 [Candidatus Cyrtobacter comes]|uniref:WH2 domain-containing protein n=1 Tax=Candidatus Cyrtobacter comes TaxID=675776 RepID=A0ABU5L9I3_9RICK|nr:hypothetical protein [Candidatus Cyrtobacter comes]MDZ5762773.1 hypothetical protein [Candidatus Cyrtobacter comes]